MYLNLLRAELLSIYPVDPTAPVDPLSRRPREYSTRTAPVQLAGQVESDSESNTGGDAFHGIEWNFTVTIRKADCTRLSYTPHIGDKVTAIRFQTMTSRTDTMYVQDIKQFCEGMGYQMKLTDRQPVRGV